MLNDLHQEKPWFSHRGGGSGQFLLEIDGSYR